MSPSRTDFAAAPYDTTTKVTTAAICVLFVVLYLAVHVIPILVISAAIIIVSYLYSPRGYAISDGAIVIKRLVGNVRLPLEAVRESRRTTAEDLSGTLKLWGNGGLFGYYGLFRTSKLGKCSWYVTNRGNTVVVVTAAKTAIFSPDDVDGFLAAIQAAAPAMGGASGDATRSEGRGIPVGAMAGIVIGTSALALVAVALLYSPGPPRYDLTPRTLRIHDRFYPVTLQAGEVDVANVRVVDLTMDKEWRPTMLTNGFANAHYRSGWFRVANGQTVRIYRADGLRLVLLPPKSNGAAVLIEVKDPDQFAREVREEW